MNLKIAWFYPDLMSTYGDRGNIIALQYRSRQRDIRTDVKIITLETKASLIEECDLLFMGGAQDRQQKIAADDIYNNKGPVIRKMIEGGIPGLFICGAYQFMGHYYRPAEGDDVRGLGVFDLYTRHFGKNKPRCIGNTIAKIAGLEDLTGHTLVGFENHGGRTYLGKGCRPLAKILKGFGNNGEDDTEGAVYKNAIGSYFHGPLLPKNPPLTDFLISTALCKKYGKEIKLSPLDDNLEWQAHNFIKEKITNNE